MLRTKHVVLFALLQAFDVGAQGNVSPTCGNKARNTVIPDSLFEGKRFRDRILPAMRNMICGFTDMSYCHRLGRPCTYEVRTFDGNDIITIGVTRDERPGSASLGPCPRVMDQIISQCIDGPTKFSSGSAITENVEYTITFRRQQGVPSIDDMQKYWFSSDDLTQEYLAQLPQKVRDRLSYESPPAPSNPQNDPSNDPPANPTTGCEKDVEDLINKLNSDFGENIDIANPDDAAKFVDSARGKGTIFHDWWRIASSGGVSVVVGKDAQVFGFPESPSFSKNTVTGFLKDNAKTYCEASNKLIYSESKLPSNFVGYTQICMTDDGNHDKCTGQLGNAPPSV